MVGSWATKNCAKHDSGEICPSPDFVANFFEGCLKPPKVRIGATKLVQLAIIIGIRTGAQNRRVLSLRNRTTNGTFNRAIACGCLQGKSFRKTSGQVKPYYITLDGKSFWPNFYGILKELPLLENHPSPFQMLHSDSTTWKLSLQRIHKNLVIANSWEQGGTEAVLNKGNRSRQRQQGHAHIYICMHI